MTENRLTPESTLTDAKRAEIALQAARDESITAVIAKYQRGVFDQYELIDHLVAIVYRGEYDE